MQELVIQSRDMDVGYGSGTEELVVSLLDVQWRSKARNLHSQTQPTAHHMLDAACVGSGLDAIHALIWEEGPTFQVGIGILSCMTYIPGADY